MKNLILKYAPSMLLMFLGIILVMLFADQPGLTVNLSKVGLGGGELEGGGQDISIGWLFVLSGGVMFWLTWRAQQKERKEVRTRGINNMSAATEAQAKNLKTILQIALFGLAIIIGGVIIAALI